MQNLAALDSRAARAAQTADRVYLAGNPLRARRMARIARRLAAAADRLELEQRRAAARRALREAQA